MHNNKAYMDQPPPPPQRAVKVWWWLDYKYCIKGMQENKDMYYIRHRLLNDCVGGWLGIRGWGNNKWWQTNGKKDGPLDWFSIMLLMIERCHADENKGYGITPWEGILKREARLSDPSPMYWARHVMSNKVKIQNKTNVSCPLPTSFPIQAANDSHMFNTPFQVSILGRHINLFCEIHTLLLKPMCLYLPALFLTSDDYRMARSLLCAWKKKEKDMYLAERKKKIYIDTRIMIAMGKNENEEKG